MRSLEGKKYNSHEKGGREKTMYNSEKDINDLKEEHYHQLVDEMREWRMDEKISQKRLAGLAGIGKTYLSKIENHKTRASDRLLQKLMTLLRMENGEEEPLEIIPIWEKMTLTVDEASAYSNIGVNRIRDMLNEPKCPFVVFVGNKRLIKRKEFEKYIKSHVYV